MLKVQDNPPMLPPTIRSVAEVQGDWWVAHTKARQEKVVAHLLDKMGIAYYLPMIEQMKMSGGKWRHMMYPLFGSYVFFCGSVDNSYRVTATGRVGQVIRVADRSRFVAELESVERVIASKCELDLRPTQSAGGQRCRVTRGPLEGTTGTIIQRDDCTRLILPVSLLGFGPSLEIDADLLEPAD